MNTMRFVLFSVILFAISILATSSPIDTTEYLCIGKHVVGFSFDSNTQEWISDNFNPQRYLIQKPDKNG
ncbi:MAG TPA: hypothetical protein VH327_08170, partial [Gammaproteobacteria bacterium]|nr:hypothetical protein [Gammaproteobacteria bacterium]